MLHDILTGIEDNIVDIIQGMDFSDIDADLSDITVIKGRRQRGFKAKPPLVAVYMETSDVNHAQMSNHEVWTVPIVIIGMLQKKDPEEGRRITTELIAKARDEVIKGRNLGMNEIRDVKGTGFTPADERAEVGNHIFGAGATLDVSFTYRL